MNILASRTHLAETIADIINLKTLEVYRAAGADIALSFSEAKLLDGHLADVGEKIIDALHQAPDPDAYEAWLIEKKNAADPKSAKWDKGCRPVEVSFFQPLTQSDSLERLNCELDLSNIKFINEVLPEQIHVAAPSSKNTKEATIEPDAEPDDKSQEPSDGGDLDTQSESDETPAAVFTSLAEKPGADKVPDPADCGAEPGTPTESKFVTKLKAWKETEGLSNMEIERRSGISNVTIHSILTGKTKNPAPKTRKKLLRVMRAKPKKSTPKTKPKNNKAPSPAPKTNGKGPGQFVQLKLNAWMGRERLGIADTAKRLGMTESCIRSIMVGSMPHKNILVQLARNIPDIQTNLHELLKQAQG